MKKSVMTKENGGNTVKKQDGGKNSVVDGYIAATLLIAIVLGLLVGCLFNWYRRKRSKGLSRARNPHTASNSTLADGIQSVPLYLLKIMTNNFSEDNILGRGGFGTVYKGKFDEDITLAVKRMKSEEIVGESSSDFEAEIAVLKGVIHRNIVGLAGYCLEENEKIIVYEYMPHGPLSKHLFKWKEEKLKALTWKKRLMIAIDVAKGVEYLHDLAHQCSIHRDLKPSNILLGSDMRAKVADFGLARFVSNERGSISIEARFEGTIGYIAPECAFGRVTAKVDVYSFGVILMELITGRQVLDDNQPEEDRKTLVSWFQKSYLDPDLFIREAIDPEIEKDMDPETLTDILKVGSLANQCTAREPEQRPNMSHVVVTLSNLVPWIPPPMNNQDIHGVDLTTLGERLKYWQDVEIDTNTSLHRSPSGFASSSTRT